MRADSEVAEEEEEELGTWEPGGMAGGQPGNAYNGVQTNAKAR